METKIRFLPACWQCNGFNDAIAFGNIGGDVEAFWWGEGSGNRGGSGGRRQEGGVDVFFVQPTHVVRPESMPAWARSCAMTDATDDGEPCRYACRTLSGGYLWLGRDAGRGASKRGGMINSVFDPASVPSWEYKCVRAPPATHRCALPDLPPRFALPTMGQQPARDLGHASHVCDGCVACRQPVAGCNARENLPHLPDSLVSAIIGSDR